MFLLLQDSLCVLQYVLCTLLYDTECALHILLCIMLHSIMFYTLQFVDT
jgi:hypothetical protein